MSKISFALVIIFLVAVGSLILLNIFYTSSPTLTTVLQQEQPKEKANVSSSGNTLSFSPPRLLLKNDMPTTINVTLNTAGDRPSLIQMEIGFDPTRFADVQITPGDFFQTPNVLLHTINMDNGRISYAIASGDSAASITASPIVAKITLLPKATFTTTQTTLTFLPKTRIETVSNKIVPITMVGTTLTVMPFTQLVSSQSAQKGVLEH